MINAYLFVNLDIDSDHEGILDSVKDIPEVKEAWRLYGTYDLVLLLEVESTDKLKEITLKSVRKLRFVESTMTMIALDSYYKED